MDFEKRHFPDWHQYFELSINCGSISDILLARDADGTLIGTTLLSSKQSKGNINNILWHSLLGEGCGSIGCLGVAEHARERGVGLAMAAKATEILKYRGFNMSYLGWTWLVDWYGKLGYKVWQEYKMSWKELP